MNSSNQAGFDTLPEMPIGDLVNYSPPDGEQEGEVEYGDIDSETGAPKRRTISTSKLTNKLATGTASTAQRRAMTGLAARNPAAARDIATRAEVRKAARNETILFESIKGGRFMSSDLGVGAKLRPTEVDALKAALYLSTPFQPTVFTFTAGTLDLVTSLNSVIGTASIYYAGVFIVLAASTLNINQGAVITMVRHLTTVNAVIQQVSNTIELQSGVNSVEIMLLNAILVSGKPRFWAPLVAGAAVAAANTDIDIVGLPANYTATARFLQPGDAVIEQFLNLL
jgi:hypothetical protein